MSNKSGKILGIVLLMFLVIEVVAFIIMNANGFIGKSSYYLFFTTNIIFTIIGLFVVLFGLLGFLLVAIPFVKELDSYKYKRKRGFTKKGRKEIKDAFIAMGITLGTLLVGVVFSYFGISRGYQCIQDIDYINNPKIVELTNCSIKYTHFLGRYLKAARYTLTGEDFSNNKYKFTIGRYPSWLSDCYSDDIIILTYLPNTKIILKIDK